MTTFAKDWLNELLIPSDDYAGHRNWGFTIYRTGYASSDEQMAATS
ncbi:hypothetical protein AA0120_g10989 [Alternaria tenuissima]|nr:hypothetical protein AA0120_g10989 [Alternaria tenuissima]